MGWGLDVGSSLIGSFSGFCFSSSEQCVLFTPSQNNMTTCFPISVDESVPSPVCCSILSWNGQTLPGSFWGNMKRDASHTQLNSPQALPMPRKLMVETSSLINTCDSTRDNEAFCKICACCWWQRRCRRKKKKRWHEIVIFTKRETTSVLFTNVNPASEYSINICLIKWMKEEEN